VVEGAVALVKAELRLVTSEVRTRALDVAVSMALAVSALAVGQVALLVLALSPALATIQPWPVVLGMVGLPAILALAIAVAAVRRMRASTARGAPRERTARDRSIEARAARSAAPERRASRRAASERGRLAEAPEYP